MNSSSVDTRVACVIVLDTPPISTIYKAQKKKKVKMYDDATNRTHLRLEKFNRNNRKTNSFVSSYHNHPSKKNERTTGKRNYNNIIMTYCV